MYAGVFVLGYFISMYADGHFLAKPAPDRLHGIYFGEIKPSGDDAGLVKVLVGNYLIQNGARVGVEGADPFYVFSREERSFLPGHENQPSSVMLSANTTYGVAVVTYTRYDDEDRRTFAAMTDLGAKRLIDSIATVTLENIKRTGKPARIVVVPPPASSSHLR